MLSLITKREIFPQCSFWSVLMYFIKFFSFTGSWIYVWLPRYHRFDSFPQFWKVISSLHLLSLIVRCGINEWYFNWFIINLKRWIKPTQISLLNSILSNTVILGFYRNDVADISRFLYMDYVSRDIAKILYGDLCLHVVENYSQFHRGNFLLKIYESAIKRTKTILSEKRQLASTGQWFSNDWNSDQYRDVCWSTLFPFFQKSPFMRGKRKDA